MELKFELPGLIVKKDRPRFNRKTRTCYTTPETRLHERTVALAAKKAMKEQKQEMITEGGVRLDFVAFFHMPKSFSKKKKEELALMPVPKKPDKDNILKALMDGMNSIVYDDDKRVTAGSQGKYYEGPNHPAGIVVKVRDHNERYKDE